MTLVLMRGGALRDDFGEAELREADDGRMAARRRTTWMRGVDGADRTETAEELVDEAAARRAAARVAAAAAVAVAVALAVCDDEDEEDGLEMMCLGIVGYRKKGVSGCD